MRVGGRRAGLDLGAIVASLVWIKGTKWACSPWVVLGTKWAVECVGGTGSLARFKGASGLVPLWLVRGRRWRGARGTPAREVNIEICC
jgi:hypothetical protein